MALAFVLHFKTKCLSQLGQIWRYEIGIYLYLNIYYTHISKFIHTNV